jgi:hypothetical protein
LRTVELKDNQPSPWYNIIWIYPIVFIIVFKN